MEIVPLPKYSGYPVQWQQITESQQENQNNNYRQTESGKLGTGGAAFGGAGVCRYILHPNIFSVLGSGRYKSGKDGVFYYEWAWRKGIEVSFG